MTTTDKLAPATGKGRAITLWTLSRLVTLTFLAAAAGKLAGTAAMVEMFDKVGLGQWFRYFTGLLEVAGGIGLLLPRYAFYAAVLPSSWLARSSRMWPYSVVRRPLRLHCWFSAGSSAICERTKS